MSQKEPVYIGFGNQKGGVGKTTLAEVTASLLSYELGYDLFVVDCDYGQHSFYKMREKELEAVRQDTVKAQQLIHYLEHKRKSAYNVYKSNISEAIELANKASETQAFDVAIFDLPGRCDNTSLLELALNLDHLIIPIEMDRQSLQSSIAYASAVLRAKEMFQGVRLKTVHMLWNKVKKNVRLDLIREYNKRFEEEIGVEVFEQVIADLIRFREGLHDVNNITEVFRSTLVAPRLGKRSATGLNELLREVDGLLSYHEQEEKQEQEQ